MNHWGKKQNVTQKNLKRDWWGFQIFCTGYNETGQYLSIVCWFDLGIY